MFNKYRKLQIFAFLIFFLVIILLPNKVQGASPGYTIKSYNIDINVNENNSFDITETITANFTEKRHGIIRNIPNLNNVVRNDGSYSINYAFITDIKVSEEYNKSGNLYNTSLKIGSATETVLGEHTYTIKYKYNILGEDGLDNADEFYFNLIGTEWDTDIENVTFKVTMPKKFDSSLLGFSSGNIGSKDSSNVQYSVDGNVITGSIKKPLGKEQGLTIRLTLPEGYFSSILLFINKQYIKIILIICVLFILRAFTFWSKYGKDETVVETVEFYPPEGYNSAEIGYIYNGEVTTEAIISMLIGLANKGYIEIEEIKKEGIFQKKTFKIKRLKSYTGDDEIEKKFYKGLFLYGEPDPESVKKYAILAEKRGKKLNEKELKERIPVKTVTEKDLKNKFYSTIESIKKQLEYDKNEIFEKNDKRQRKIKFMANIISFLSLCNIFMQSGYILYKIISVAVLQCCISNLINRIFFNRRKTFGNLIAIGMLTGISVFLMTITNMLQSAKSKTFYILILLGIIILGILNILMSKRTKKGTEVIGKIRGFRRFLETAEKEQLEALVEKNPQYFYDILPYTYALGISKKWIEQFETIAISPPSWYINSDTSFNTYDFTRALDNTVKEVSNFMTYKATEDSGSSYSSSYSSSSSSSSSSGGGSSGGGSGGRRRKFVVKEKNKGQKTRLLFQQPLKRLLFFSKYI